MAMIKPGFTTMSQSNPAVFAGKPYRYRGDPRWEPGDRRYRQPRQGEPLPQNRKATSAKRQRMAEYTRRRLEGQSKDEAGAALGISASTASYYERDFKDEQRRESAP